MPSRLTDYRIISKLGSGSFGVVFKVQRNGNYSCARIAFALQSPLSPGDWPKLTTACLIFLLVFFLFVLGAADGQIYVLKQIKIDGMDEKVSSVVLLTHTKHTLNTH